MRHARYRNLRKTHLEHVFAAVALNLIRLDAWWSGHPLDRNRVSHLARLDLSLAASPLALLTKSEPSHGIMQA